MATTFTWILGIVLLLVGIWGMVQGGHDHELMGFGVNMLHNVVHLGSGLAGILAALAGARWVRTYLLAFGAVYGLVTILGFLDVEPVVRLLNINMADNWLHLAITAACLLFAFTSPAATTVRRR